MAIIQSIKDKIEDTFIDKILQQILDGNKGSNFLTALVTLLLAANIDYAKAIRGFTFKDMSESTESAKLVAQVVLAVFGYLVGKYGKKP